MQHTIIYGPKGSGKYTKALELINCSSFTRSLKLPFQKTELVFTASDLHYEIDVSQLGCNSTAIWNLFYNQVVDIVSTKKTCTILCLQFQDVSPELLDNITFHKNITYIFLTTNYSFIPTGLAQKCVLVRVAKQSPNYITTIKYAGCTNINVHNPHLIICDKIIDELGKPISSLRDHIYEMLTYNINVHDCITYIVQQLIIKGLISVDNDEMWKLICLFLKQYHNNFRPIYHIECLLYSLKTLFVKN